jgi:hypothetical protein
MKEHLHDLTEHLEKAIGAGKPAGRSAQSRSTGTGKFVDPT